MTSVHNKFVEYPTGKIARGGWCDHCMSFNTRKITSSVLVIAEGKVLFVQRARDPQAGFWAFPGGYLDWDETVKQCACRELEEETGIQVTEDQLCHLTVASDPNRDLDGRQNVDIFFYVILPKKPKTNPQKTEVSVIDWFALEQLPDQIAFDHHKMVELYKQLKK